MDYKIIFLIVIILILLFLVKEIYTLGQTIHNNTQKIIMSIETNSKNINGIG
jgi:predicted Holliday junction resolvase-like endonuclease